MKERTSAKRDVAGGALVFAAVLLSLLLAEVIVRVVAPQSLPSQALLRRQAMKDMYVSDDDAGFRLAPRFEGTLEDGNARTTFRTNSLGLRDDELTPKTENQQRILVLGDSFVWGWGADQGEEWVSLVEKALGDSLGAEAIDVVNGGVNAYGTEGELSLLKRLGSVIQPDLVLVAFFTNDFTDNLLGTKGVYTVKEGYLFDEFSSRHFRENLLMQSSHLARLFDRGWGEARRRIFKLPPSTRPVRNFTEADFEQGMQLSKDALLEARDVAAGLGARFAVLWLHADVYVIPREEPDVPIQRKLQEAIAAAEIPSLDLMPALRTEMSRAGLFIPRDGHFSGRGNRVAARAVTSWLLASGLLQDVPPRETAAKDEAPTAAATP